MTSAIWFPTVYTGLSETKGSWKIIEILLPLMWESSLGVAFERSMLSNRISPASILAVFLFISPTRDLATVVFPQPDSPTIPSTSPFFIEKVTSSAAGMTLVAV